MNTYHMIVRFSCKVSVVEYLAEEPQQPGRSQALLLLVWVAGRQHEKLELWVLFLPTSEVRA